MSQIPAREEQNLIPHNHLPAHALRNAGTVDWDEMEHSAHSCSHVTVRACRQEKHIVNSIGRVHGAFRVFILYLDLHRSTRVWSTRIFAHIPCCFVTTNHIFSTQCPLLHVPTMFCNKTNTFLDKYSAQYIVKLTFFWQKKDERPFAWTNSGLQRKRCEPRSNAQKHLLLLRSCVESLNLHPTPPPAPPPAGPTPRRARRGAGGRTARTT